MAVRDRGTNRSLDDDERSWRRMFIPINAAVYDYKKVKRQMTDQLIDSFNHIAKTLKNTFLDVYDGVVFDSAYAVTLITQITKFSGTREQCVIST